MLSGCSAKEVNSSPESRAENITGTAVTESSPGDDRSSDSEEPTVSDKRKSLLSPGLMRRTVVSSVANSMSRHRQKKPKAKVREAARQAMSLRRIFLMSDRVTAYL